jgi:hypothetical protein
MTKFDKFDRYLDDNEILTEMRNLKLILVSGEIDFKINKDFLRSNKKLFRFIKKIFPNDIVSGSFVLKAFGLINRELNDIDILISDRDRYSSYYKSDYDDTEINLSNRLGYRDIYYKDGIFSFKKKYHVDFFENKSASYVIVDGIKLHNLLEILNCKVSMIMNMPYSESGIKHRKDLTDIFRMLHSLSNLEN